MFGYLQPMKDEMKLKEYRLYKSVYCGLCRVLKKEYGMFSTLTLSYDCTVLTMLYLSVRGEDCCVQQGRCTVNPLKKCLLCSSKSEAFRMAGAVSVLMGYYKLQDTMHDGGFVKKTAAFSGRLLLRHSYRKAAKAYPEIDRAAAEMMQQQSEAEKSNAGIDRAADATAVMVRNICRMFSQDEEQRRTLGVFGYYVGRWIYLMDAADDLEKDRKHHCFNPFLPAYDGDIQKTMQYCNEVLNLTASQMVLAYELLQRHSYAAVLDNIIYEGMPAQQKKVTEKKDIKHTV